MAPGKSTADLQVMAQGAKNLATSASTIDGLRSSLMSQLDANVGPLRGMAWDEVRALQPELNSTIQKLVAALNKLSEGVQTSSVNYDSTDSAQSSTLRNVGARQGTILTGLNGFGA